MPRSKQGLTKLRILLADREGIFRLGLQRLLSSEDDFRVVAQAEDAAQCMAMLETFQPDLALIQEEIASHGNRNLLVQIHRRSPACKIIIMASRLLSAMSAELLAGGATALISKADSPELFIRNLRRALNGQSALADPVLRAHSAIPAKDSGSRRIRPVDTLTHRERTIVSCLTLGWRNREIAGRLEITEQTVKNHLRSIFDKVGVSDRLELVLYAIHQKLELPTADL